MNVLSKLGKLPLWGKITIAIVVAIALGCVGYLVLGPVAGGLAGIGGAFASIGSLFRSEPTASDTAKDLARRNREGAETKLREIHEAVAERARVRSEARKREADEMARRAGMHDDGDPRRVYDRIRRGPS